MGYQSSYFSKGSKCWSRAVLFVTLTLSSCMPSVIPASPQRPEPPSPTVAQTARVKLGALVEAVPDSAVAYVEVPGLARLETALEVPRDEIEQRLDLLLLSAGSKFGLLSVGSHLRETAQRFAGASVFVLDTRRAGAVMRFEPDAPVVALMKQQGFSEKGEYWQKGGSDILFRWLDSLNVLALAQDQETMRAIEATLHGKQRSFATTNAYVTHRGELAWFYLDLHKAAQWVGTPLDKGSFVVGKMGDDVSLDVQLLGDKVPALGDVLAATPSRAFSILPPDVGSGVMLSVARKPGKSLSDVVRMVARSIGEVNGMGATLGDRLVSSAPEVVGLSMEELDRALGAEVAIGSEFSLGGGKGKPPVVAVHVAAIEVRDDALGKKALEHIQKRLKKLPGYGSVAGGFRMAAPDTKDVVQVVRKPGWVLVAFGPKNEVSAVLKTVPAKSDEASWLRDAQKLLPTDAHLAGLWNLRDLIKMATQLGVDPESLQSIPPSVFASVLIESKPRGVLIRAKSGPSLATAAVFGAGSAVAIEGVRKYLLRAKMAEAKEALGRIANDAVSAYEREHFDSPMHRFCGSAEPSWPTVPRGTKVIVTDRFDTGDATRGWRCLKFTMLDPVYYRYTYQAGSGYLGPARGGPDPGPNGFEVAAEGDLDADGRTSLTTIVGRVLPSGKIELSEIFSSEPEE